MEGSNESYLKFKSFLNTLFIREKEEGFKLDDFMKDNYEYIESHLEELLPLISIEEAKRIKIYFLKAYIFHLKSGLRVSTISPRSLTPEPVIAQLDFEEVSQQERHETESRIVDSDLQQEPTHLETGPLMQSTPLSVPLLPYEPRIEIGQKQLNGVEGVFVADVISQMNISPIPIVSDPLRIPNVQPTAISSNVNLNEVSFLKNFAHIEEKAILREKPSAHNIARRIPKRLNNGSILRESKKRMSKVNFEVLCCLPHKQKTEEQTKRSEESFLFFPLMSGKTKNILNRIICNTSLPEGERGHISIERIINFSNILRAHASQSQTSLEQPVQSSQINTTRSPLTPNDLLRSSQFLPFTPLRGDISDFQPRMVIDQAASFPTRSLLRQQPLLTIPETESSIHIQLSPQVEELYINDSETFTNLPREVPVNVELLDGQPLEIAYNGPSQIETQQNNVPLNSSVMNIEQLVEREPEPISSQGEGQPSNIPGMISEDFEIIQQPQPPADSLTYGPESHSIDHEMETRVGFVPTSNILTSPGFLQEEPLLTGVDPMLLQRSTAQDTAIHVHEQGDNLQFSWYEILRPRAANVEYPRESPTHRRKKRRRIRENSEDRIVRPRRNYELPLIPISPSHQNINDLAEPPVAFLNQVPQNQESMSLNALSCLPQAEAEVSNQNIQNPTLSVNDLGENLLSSPARHSENIAGISNQTTQYPVQIENNVKEYLELIKQSGRKLEYVKWERFDSSLFNKNDRFELYTNIFKRIIKNNYVAMDRLYENGATRLEAAKGFRFILELKTMGLIEIESFETQLLGVRLIPEINAQKI